LFHQEKLKLITVLGAGLLCGTALAVIIPEGVHALYEDILEGRLQQKQRRVFMVSQTLFDDDTVALHYVGNRSFGD